MSAAVGVRDDYDASTLRGLARTSEDLRQARRLLSLACVHDGMSRADAAKGGGRDRVHRFNEAGPEGLFDRRVPRPRWPADQRYKPACLFGAVCADRETGAALMLP